MIVHVITNNLNRLYTKKILFIALVFSIYSALLKRKVSTLDISYWEYIIYAMTDHYYILYFMIICYIFLLFRLFNEDEEIIWIRSGTFIKYFISQMISILVISTMFVFLHLLIVLIIGYGLRADNLFTNLNIDLNTFVVGGFSEYFSTPLIAISITILHMIFGFTFLGTLFLFLRQFLNTKFVILSIIFLYFLMLLSIRSDVDSLLPFIFINNYIILHHAFAVLDHQYYTAILIELVLIGCMCITVKKYWHKKLTLNTIIHYKNCVMDKWNFSMLFSKKNMILIVTLSVLIVLSIIFKYDNITFYDMLILQFYGHGTGYFDLMDFISLVIYNGIPIYLLSHFLEKERTDRSSLVTIRLKYMKSWLASIMRSTIVFILMYVLLTIVITIIISWLLGLPFNDYDYTYKLFEEFGVKKVNSSYLFAIIISSKVFELFFSFLVIFMLFCFTNNATLGFVLLQILNSLSLLDVSIVKYNPIGLSSLGRMSEFTGIQGISYSSSISILLILTGMFYLILRSGLYKNIFK